MAVPRKFEPAVFKVGDRVLHPGCVAGAYYHPGAGTVAEVVNEGGGKHSYRVRCETTGNILPGVYDEDVLTAT